MVRRLSPPPARLAITLTVSVALLAAFALGLIELRPGARAPKRTPRPPLVPATRVVKSAGQQRRAGDGSLGDEATRLACRLLTRKDIARQFRTSIGPATPAFPYCQWLVGQDSFVGLEVMPHESFQAATRFVAPLLTVAGIGSEAMIANNRDLYFTEGGTSYSLQFQTPGDFTGLNTAQLSSLARDVLASPVPPGRLPPPPPGPIGPPIYFAGDSTAAGPEWAWWAYHENRTTTRTLSEYQVGSGLLVQSYFDWPKHLLAVAAARRPKLVIWMGSANDGQAVIVNGRVAAVGSPAWDVRYADIVGTTMQGLVQEGCKVLWIGEPAMESPSLNHAMHVIDSIYAREARSHPGVVFFNPGSVLNGPKGAYTGSLVIKGRLVPVRLADGVHLDEAGSVLVANAIASYVGRMLDVRVRAR